MMIKLTKKELIKRIDKIARKIRRSLAYAYRQGNKDMVDSSRKDLEALTFIKKDYLNKKSV